MDRIEFDLREVRALAAVIYPSVKATGHSIETAVDEALAVAERMVLRSEQREQARIEEAERQRAAALGLSSTAALRARPMFPAEDRTG